MEFFENRPDQESRIEAHKDARQFMCPSFDAATAQEKTDILSFVGQETDAKSKTLKVRLFTCMKGKNTSRKECNHNHSDREISLKGKMIILLQNKMRVVMTEEKGAQEMKYAELSYIPFTRN